MEAPGPELDIQTLLRRAEQAIRTARPREQVERLLHQLLSNAAEGSEESVFAHRHLAELLLEGRPWEAALHLRQVLQADPDEDSAHALMGLCQALLGNFRAAVAAYRQALALAPANPWYNHNLGHLLDVALGRPSEALPFLRRAFQAQARHEEVGASLAHCLGRVGRRDEALALARSLLAEHPQHDELGALQTWLERGAPLPAATPGVGLQVTRTRPAALPGPVPAGGDRAGPRPVVDVERAIEDGMGRAGYAGAHIERARAIWRDYAVETRPPVSAHAVAALAAAVEYALARVDRAQVRQRDVALRHGVSVSSLAAHFASLRTRLGLIPGDARYVASSTAD